jgi:predicted enzyme related to lactoylglutathione lyase
MNARVGQPKIAAAKLQHHVIYVGALKKSKDFYMKLFDLQFSALNHPDSSAAMRLSNQEMHFFSFGFYHHDICLVKHHKLKMDNKSMLYFALVARDRDAFDAVRKRAAAMGIPVRDGRAHSDCTKRWPIDCTGAGRLSAQPPRTHIPGINRSPALTMCKPSYKSRQFPAAIQCF